jgi:hypothetical protein
MRKLLWLIKKKQKKSLGVIPKVIINKEYVLKQNPAEEGAFTLKYPISNIRDYDLFYENLKFISDYDEVTWSIDARDYADYSMPEDYDNISHFFTISPEGVLSNPT